MALKVQFVKTRPWKKIDKPNKKPPTDGDRLFRGTRAVILNKNPC